MAVFRSLGSQASVMIRPMHAFGRYPQACQTVVDAADISRIHARVRWSGLRWEISDQSRNGTSSNGHALPLNEWVPLVLGSEIRMGDSADAAWRVECLDPPTTCLVYLDGTEVRQMMLQAHGNLVPDAAQPEANVFSSERGWFCEHANGVDPMPDGYRLTLANQEVWEFVLCPEVQATVERMAPARQDASRNVVVLHFDVSQNEEHTQLQLHWGQRVIDLGERIHHYTLVTLARMRMQDAARGLDPSSQGWAALDEVARMLGVDTAYVNIQLFRAKHQITSALPAGLTVPSLVERRRGEVRFGACAFKVRRGGVEEGSAAAVSAAPV